MTGLSAVDRFVRETYHPEDDLLLAINAEIAARGKPPMHIGPEQGRVLQVLMAAIGARRVLEIGTFFGYSAVWIARGLPAGGRLICLEVADDHAATARRFLARAGLFDQVEVRTGPALDLLSAVAGDGPFDLIFLDADAANYSAYLDWIERLLRPGGILIVDNAYLYGGLLRDDDRQADDDPGYRSMHEVHRRLSNSGAWTGTVMPYRDGLAVAVYRGPA
jgi:caffeoyl-CoA O-methyltransferase